MHAHAQFLMIKAISRNRSKVFEMACLWNIEDVSRRDRIRNTEIQNRLNWQKDINRRIQQRLLKHFVHIARMNTRRYRYIALYGHVRGKRQTKEKMDRHDQRRLKRNASEVL